MAMKPTPNYENIRNEREGTRILRKNGYTAGGQPKRWVDKEQCAFERKILVNAVGTKSSAWNHSLLLQRAGILKISALFFF